MSARFSNPKSGSGPVIDIKTKPVALPDRPNLPAVAGRVAPDFGDYGAEYPETLPASWRRLPWITWTVLVLFLAGWGYSEFTSERLKQTRTKVLNEGKTLADDTTGLADQAKSYSGKVKDLEVLKRWVGALAPVRGVLIAVAACANEKMQIRSLELKRSDLSIPKYSLQIICNGNKENKERFDAMCSSLLQTLRERGWRVDEATPDSQETRLVLEVTLTRATAETTEGKS